MSSKQQKKKAFGRRLISLLQAHDEILTLEITNITSSMMHKIRMALRGLATIVCGKNTTIRRVLSILAREDPEHPAPTKLLNLIRGNVALCFVQEGDVKQVADIIASHTLPAPARVGTLAPSDVYVMPGPTGCDPGKTAFFQALSIPTKIVRGQIEMTSRVHLIPVGEKVNDSAAALLKILDIQPFSYAVGILSVYSAGDVYDAKVLDLSESDLLAIIQKGARAIAAIGVELGVPTLASLPHSINNAFKRVLSVGLCTDYSFTRADEFADFLANPANFMPAAGAGGAAEEAAVEEEEEEEESESIGGGAGGLFGDSSSS